MGRTPFFIRISAVSQLPGCLIAKAVWLPQLAVKCDRSRYVSTENPERKPQKLVLWLLLAAVAGLFIVGGNVTGRASGEDQATGCGGRIDSENDQAQVEDELKFHRASTKSECGVNKTVLLSKSGQRRCVCNDGFVLKPSGACSNRWGKPIYTASLTQDNGGVKVKTPHARALSFGVPVPNRRVRNKKYAPRCRVKNALTKEFLPAQCQAMAFWPTKVGTFFTKWLKVTFVSKTFHSDQVPYVLYVYESTSPDKAKVKLANIVQNRGTKRLLINNGALQFQIERKGPIIQKARFSAPGTS